MNWRNVAIVAAAFIAARMVDKYLNVSRLAA